MLRKIFSVCAVLAMALPTQAIIWQCDNFDTSKKLCRLKGWSGSQPSSGKLTLPISFKHTDGKEYTVVSVAPHALDGLTDVTEITIPAQISAIGDQKLSSGLRSYEHRVKNFENCPKLIRFNVADGNPVFSADESGLLLTDDGVAILRVPAKIKTNNGAFTIKTSVKIIGENSFKENSSIKSLYFPSNISVYQNGGLNDTKNLAEYHFSGEGGSWEYPLQIEGNCLIEHKYNGYTAISVPPASTRQTLTLGNDVAAVGKNAFKNTQNLKTVDLGRVKYIADRIIENSAVEVINIPSTVIFIRESALRNAPKLISLTLEAPDLEIPKDFARDCPRLEKISSKKNITALNARAFMNCSALMQFPFTTATECIFADSVFFNTAFKKVTFNDANSDKVSDANRDALCNAMFSNCEALHTIDFSGVTDTEKEYLSFPSPLAKKCEKLRRVIFPPFSIFWGDSDDKDHQPAFNTTNLSEIELGTFQNNANGSQFRYTPIEGKTEFTPNVYLALTRNRNLDSKHYRSMPLYNLFEGVNGAKVIPNFYCDLYAPEDDVYADHVAQRGIYYVPGGCADNYSDVKESGRQVKQMFKFSLTKEGSKMIAKTFRGEVDVTDMRLTVNGNQTIRMNIGEEYKLPVPFKEITSVLLRYKVNDVELSTLYPPAFWDLSGAGASFIEEVDSPETAPYFLFHLSGVKIAEGTGSPDTSDLSPGVYILKRGVNTEKIIIQ